MLFRSAALQENQPRRRKKGVPIEITEHDKKIKDLGRQYAIVICPWVDLSHFGHKGRPVADPSSPDRFKTKLSQHEACIAELYDFVPESLHALMEKHSHFGDLVSPWIISLFEAENSFEFRTHVGAMRSTAAHGIREQAPVIFSMNGSWFANGVDRSTIPELQKLVTINGEYAAFPKVLYPSDAMKKADVFRTDIIAKVSSKFALKT